MFVGGDEVGGAREFLNKQKHPEIEYPSVEEHTCQHTGFIKQDPRLLAGNSLNLHLMHYNDVFFLDIIDEKTIQKYQHTQQNNLF